MKSDIQIAQEAEMLPIKEVADKRGSGEDYTENTKLNYPMN